MERTWVSRKEEINQAIEDFKHIGSGPSSDICATIGKSLIF